MVEHFEPMHYDRDPLDHPAEGRLTNGLPEAVGTPEPDRLPSRIADHAKSILGHATGISLEHIEALRALLDRLELEIHAHEAKLAGAIERHVALTESATQTTRILQDQLAAWTTFLKDGGEECNANIATSATLTGRTSS